MNDNNYNRTINLAWTTITMLLISIIIIILFSASILRRDFSILFSRTSLIVLLTTLFINYNEIYFIILEKGISLYNGLYQTNSNSLIFGMFIIILSYLILGLNSYYPRKTLKISYNSNEINGLHKYNPRLSQHDKILAIDNNISNTKTTTNLSSSYTENNNEDYYSNLDLTIETDEHHNSKLLGKTSEKFKIIEYSLLILFIVCGAIFLISTNDLISIFISIELQSYGLYLLSSVYRNSELSTKAGLTYFLLGGLSSCIILLAQGLLYINSGTTNLENIYILSNIPFFSIDIMSNNIIDINSLYDVRYINLSLAVLCIGFLFKVSAAPFHFWSPDVYDGVPTLVTTFIAIIAKISIFIFLLELVHFTNNNYTDLSLYNWNNNLLLSSLLSLIIGTVLGLTQFRIKRLYAYSTISHVGFILLSLSINSTESVQAFVFYLIQYSISNLNAFVILITIGYFIVSFYNNNKDYVDLKEKNNSPIQLISQIKGFYKINVLLALSLGITLFSFLGVPPLIGFFGKQMVLSASLDGGYTFMSLIAILTSVISAVYYLVVIKQIFFDENEYEVNNTQYTHYADKVNNKSNYVKLSGYLTSLISILTLIILIFIFIPNESLNLIKILSLFIFNL